MNIYKIKNSVECLLPAAAAAATTTAAAAAEASALC